MLWCFKSTDYLILIINENNCYAYLFVSLADMSQVTPNEESNQILLTDPAQSVLEMGYQPRIIKKAIDIILRTEGN